MGERAQSAMAASEAVLDLPDGELHGSAARARSQSAARLNQAADVRVLRRGGCGAAGTWQELAALKVADLAQPKLKP